MSRFKVLGIDNAPAGSVEQLKGFKAALGSIPNIFGTMAHSPAVLQGYAALSGALEGATLSPQLQEKIALTVAEVNQCNYCLSAHTVIGKMKGLSPEAILAGRRAAASDPREDAILKFAREIVVQRAEVSDADVKAVRDAGATDAEILEVVAVVTLNIFTNYFNHVAGTEVDFPLAPPL